MKIASRSMLVSGLFLIFGGWLPAQNRQSAMDEPVAKLTDGPRAEVIRFSDVMTQLALQPATSLDPVSPADFDSALLLVLNQRILEIAATEEAIAFAWMPTNNDISTELANIGAFFPSRTDFEARLRVAGFDSQKDERLFSIIQKRLLIEWYVEAHFRRPFLPSREIAQRFYVEVFVPGFLRAQPHSVLPTFEEKRSEIERTIANRRADEEIKKYLDRARSRYRIGILPRR